MIKRWFILPLLIHTMLWGVPSTDTTTLYNSLDRCSIAQLLAFYHLYQDTPQGKLALSDAWALIRRHREEETGCCDEDLTLPSMEIDPIIALVNKQPFDPPTPLNGEQLSLIEKISNHLSNRKLEGFTIWNKDDLIPLPSEKIDLARALLLYQFEDNTLQIRRYEAGIDLISLQILARLPLHPSHEEKIRAINHFIFHEQRFRFPPHSLYAQDIDLYTFLPSVLDKRLGVCLGVSILYLSIAQRLDLPLEIITPPGHIFIRYNMGEHAWNIETTARGIHLPDRSYLGINTRRLQQRTLKEVIGLAFMNQAAVTWQRGDYQTSIHLYEQALPYLPTDPLIKMFLAYNYLFADRIVEGKKLLEEISDTTSDYFVSKEVSPEDFLNDRVNIEGIKVIFSHVDENRRSILDKQKKLQDVLKQFPLFRDGLLQLATTHLQMGREQKAYEVLLQYHAIDPTNPTVEYYLATICTNRLNYGKAWYHLKQAQMLTARRDHHPLCLKQLKYALRTLFPDPEERAHPP